MASPAVARRLNPTVGKKEKVVHKPAPQQQKVTPTGKRPASGTVIDASAKKARAAPADSDDGDSDGGAASRLEVGDKVVISTLSAKKELRGKTATVVSVNAAWTKVNVPGTGEVSLRAKELSPTKAAAPRAQSKITLAPAVGAYPSADPGATGLSAAAAARSLGRGEGAASAQSAAALVGAVCDFEVARVAGALAAAAGTGGSAAAAAEPLVAMLGAVGEAAKLAVPHAVDAARARRLAGATSGQAAKLAAEVEALRKAELAWAALEAAQALGGGGDDVSDSGEGEGGESDGDDDDQAGFTLDLLADDAASGQQQVEAAALELEGLNQGVMRAQVVARRAAEVETLLAQSNQGLHFAGDLAAAVAVGDAKGAIRGLIAKSPNQGKM
jgi:hypothetical protein